jgi:hypothetical protein
MIPDRTQISDEVSRLPSKFKNSNGLADASEYCLLNWRKIERRERLCP